VDSAASAVDPAVVGVTENQCDGLGVLPLEPVQFPPSLGVVAHVLLGIVEGTVGDDYARDDDVPWQRGQVGPHVVPQDVLRPPLAVPSERNAAIVGEHSEGDEVVVSGYRQTL